MRAPIGCALCGTLVEGDFYTLTRFGYPRHTTCTEVWVQRNGRLEADLVPNTVCPALIRAWVLVWRVYRNPVVRERLIKRLPRIGWFPQEVIRAVTVAAPRHETWRGKKGFGVYGTGIRTARPVKGTDEERPR